MLTAVVGSLNPVKIEGVRMALNLLVRGGIDVQGIEVDSKVSHQPTTMEEAMKGAYSRAYAVGRQHAVIDLAIGIEGGIWPAPKLSGVFPSGLPEYYDTQWVVIWARQHDTWWSAGTVAIPIPPAIMQWIDEGTGIGGACDLAFDLQNSKQEAGLTGLLSDHHLSRAQAICDATLFGLNLWRHPEWFV